MDGSRKRVLIVEDDTHGRHLLSLLLADQGYDVCAARDGLEALTELIKQRFDVVITAYNLPRINGLEFVGVSRVLRPRTPIILVSGETPGVGERAVEQGAFAWIQKPYECCSLLEVLSAAMQGPGCSAEPAVQAG